MDVKKYTTLFLMVSFFKLISPHGFGGKTLVETSSGSYWQVDKILECMSDKQNLDVLSYDEFSGRFVAKKVKRAGFSEVDYYSRVCFKDDIKPLECTPLQLFYRMQDHAWVAAFKLKTGDRLLCSDNKAIEISSIELIHEKLKVYTLEIKGTHTFLVSRHRIVAHNMLLPIGAITGLTIPFDIGCGASVGSAFGPVGICTGVVVGAVVGCIVNACIKDRVVEYRLSFKPKEVLKSQEIDNLYHLAKSVDEILKDALPGNKTKGQAKQYIKKGGYPAAVKDFEDLGPTNVKNIPGKEGKMGTLPDGREVNVRVESTDQRPTLEIMIPGGDGKRIKIRYEESKS